MVIESYSCFSPAEGSPSPAEGSPDWRRIEKDLSLASPMEDNYEIGDRSLTFVEWGGGR